MEVEGLLEGVVVDTVQDEVHHPLDHKVSTRVQVALTAQHNDAPVAVVLNCKVVGLERGQVDRSVPARLEGLKVGSRTDSEHCTSSGFLALDEVALQRLPREALAILTLIDLHHALNLLDKRIIDKLLNLKRVIGDVKTEHDPFMLVLTPVFKRQLMIETVRLVLYLTCTRSISDVLPNEVPVLTGTVGLVESEGVEVVVGYLQTVFEQFFHVLRLNRGGCTRLTMRKV